MVHEDAECRSPDRHRGQSTTASGSCSGGFIIAETTEALTLREAALPAVQYIPRKDVRMDLLDRTSHHSRCPYKGEASYFTASAGGMVVENAAWTYETPFESVGRIAGYLAFYPEKVDAIEEFT